MAAGKRVRQEKAAAEAAAADARAGLSGGRAALEMTLACMGASSMHSTRCAPPSEGSSCGGVIDKRQELPQLERARGAANGKGARQSL